MASCSANHCKGANEWNHYRVEANDGLITLAVNGHVVSSVSKCKPRKGYLALESEGSECRFKNLKIKELPSTNPKKDEVADEAQGHKTLYTGLDLSGWKADDDAKKHWQPRDTVLHYDGKGEAKDNGLPTDKEYGDAEFVVDFKFPTKESKPCSFLVRDNADGHLGIIVKPGGDIDAYQKLVSPDGRVAGSAINTPMSIKPAGQWNRLQLTCKESTLEVKVNGKPVNGLNKTGKPSKGTFTLQPGSEMDFANLFVRELK